jgi:cell division topological specificity factor
MSVFKYLKYLKNGSANSAASVAKERLQIIISHERSQRNTPDYLPQLQEEILSVIAKYIPISRDKVVVNLDRIGENAILELNVTIPENVLADA